MDARQKILLRQVFDAGVAAVAPDDALRRHVSLRGEALHAAGEAFELAGGRVFVVGAGKGAAPMARAVEALLGDRIADGLVTVKAGHALNLARIRLVEAAHPVPDAAGEAAARAMLALAAQAGAEDLVLGVFTGGASALTPLPAQGLSLEDLQRTTALLLASGADIHELNAVRKHLSAFSGGQLARAAAPARVLTVLVSDVVGDNLEVIASGPTAPDPSTFGGCREILVRHGLWERLPAPVRDRLAGGCAGAVPETPKPGDPIFARVRHVLAAANAQALDAAGAAARAEGCVVERLAAPLTGEARLRARELAELACARARALKAGDAPLCLLAGGETTVTVRGPGKGGRNQEMALAASLALQGESRVAALFAGTDGTDGPTDAAGGFASGGLADRLGPCGRAEMQAALEANNAYPVLERAGALLITGPTRTNVMDLAILLAYPPR